MKPRKEKPTMDGVEFDSREEVEFYLWCKEANAHGFLSGGMHGVKAFEYHPKPFELSEAFFIEEPRYLKTKVKMVQRCLFRAHGYQPDFILHATPKLLRLAHGLVSAGDEGTGARFYIDIKPGFDPHDSRKALFAINQKWFYAKHGIYINKVVPKEFFVKTWAPDIRNKRTGWKLEKYSSCRSVEDVEPIKLEFN